MNAIKNTAMLLLSLLAITQTATAEDWLRFRGPQGTGVSAEDAETPTEFDDQKNVLWKIDLPGAGASAPIIVGDKIFLTAYSGYGQSREDVGDMNSLKRHVLCYSKSDGKNFGKRISIPSCPKTHFKAWAYPNTVTLVAHLYPTEPTSMFSLVSLASMRLTLMETNCGRPASARGRRR